MKMLSVPSILKTDFLNQEGSFCFPDRKKDLALKSLLLIIIASRGPKAEVCLGPCQASMVEFSQKLWVSVMHLL